MPPAAADITEDQRTVALSFGQIQRGTSNMFRMTAIAAALAAMVASVSSAVADDSAFRWTGFYIGLHGGKTTDASADYVYAVAGNFEPAGRVRPTEPDGWLYGAHGGYMHQFGNIVIGAEASLSKAHDMKGTLSENPPPKGNDYNTVTEFNHMIVVAGRLGYAFDRLLVYAKGGRAWAEMDFDASFHNKDGPGGTNGTVVRIKNSFDMQGWVYGAGAEYAVTDNVLVGLEWSRIDFDTSDVVTLNTTNSGIKTEKLKADAGIDQIVGRVGFKF